MYTYCILMAARVTTVAVGKQWVKLILSMCLQYACAVLVSHMWSAWLYHIIPRYLIKRRDFREEEERGFTEFVFWF